jgi:RNA polymerase sigma factor (TIGR02999 family)
MGPQSQTQATVTQLLGDLADGHGSAVDRLLPIVYDEMRRLAASYLRREGSDHTLQATALVHEAYLRLVHQTQANWKGSTHFYAVAAQAMRRILIDHAERKRAAKRRSAAATGTGSRSTRRRRPARRRARSICSRSTRRSARSRSSTSASAASSSCASSAASASRTRRW